MDENPYEPPMIATGEPDPDWKRRSGPRFGAAACGGMAGSGIGRAYEMIYLGKELGYGGVGLALLMIVGGAIGGYVALAIVQMLRVRRIP
jgi:hypothetical protein